MAHFTVINSTFEVPEALHGADYARFCEMMSATINEDGGLYEQAQRQFMTIANPEDWRYPMMVRIEERPNSSEHLFVLMYIDNLTTFNFARKGDVKRQGQYWYLSNEYAAW